MVRKRFQIAGICFIIPTAVSFVILLMIQYGIQQGTIEELPGFTGILLMITIIGHLIGWSLIGIAYWKIK